MVPVKNVEDLESGEDASGDDTAEDLESGEDASGDDAAEDLESGEAVTESEAEEQAYAQMLAIIAPLEITQTLNLSDGVLSAEAMKKMAGQPAEMLISEGYVCSGLSLASGEAVFYLDKSCYTYRVTVKEKNYKEKYSEDGEIDVKSTFRSLTIKKMTYEGLNDVATDYDLG